LKPAKSAGFAKDFIESAIDKMKTYTYNGVTVWFLSTPIQLLALCAATRPGGFFFVINENPQFDWGFRKA
jgi:hypothetical protein